MESGLFLTSNFEAGNLLKAVEVEAKNNFASEKVTNHVSIDDKYYAFELWMAPDSHPYIPSNNAGRAGMFFAVSKVPAAVKSHNKTLNIECFKPRILRFHVRNFSNQAKLLSYGHTPCVLECKQEEFSALKNGQAPWFR